MNRKSYINTTEPNIPFGANQYISQVIKNNKPNRPKLTVSVR